MFLFRIYFLFISLFIASTSSASQYVPEVRMLPEFQAQNSLKHACAAKNFAQSVERQHELCLRQAGYNKQDVDECHELLSNFVVMVKASKK